MHKDTTEYQHSVGLLIFEKHSFSVSYSEVYELTFSTLNPIYPVLTQIGINLNGAKIQLQISSLRPFTALSNPPPQPEGQPLNSDHPCGHKPNIKVAISPGVKAKTCPSEHP